MNALFQSIKGFDKSNRFLKKYKPDRPPMTIYIVRLTNLQSEKESPFNYKLGNSKPCQRCTQFLYYYNITKIRYTDIIDEVDVLCELRRIN